jgi:hypothetical protein
VNTILIENKTKFKSQETWMEKQKEYLGSKLNVIKEKITSIKRHNKHDRRLRGLYERLSALHHKKRIENLNRSRLGENDYFEIDFYGKSPSRNSE